MATCRVTVPKRVFLSLLLIGAAAPSASANRGRYDKMFALPTPGPVTIDGDLADWDRSAEIEFYVVPETRASQTAFFQSAAGEDL